MGASTPALFTHRSTLPKRSTTSRAKASTASASLTSTEADSAVSPSRASGRVRAHRPSSIPLSANVSANPAPRPRLAPVTTATRPAWVLTPAAPSAVGGHEDVLHVTVRSQGLEPELASEPGLLHPPEAGLNPHRAVGIDRQVAGLDGPGHTQGASPVPRPDGARQPVGRVVGEPDGLLLVLEGDDGHHRPEDLLPGRWW